MSRFSAIHWHPKLSHPVSCGNMLCIIHAICVNDFGKKERMNGKKEQKKTHIHNMIHKFYLVLVEKKKLSSANGTRNEVLMHSFNL